MLKIKTGNLFDSVEQYICHQCNCITKKAAHLSYDVFTRFPEANVYNTRLDGYKDKPGTIKIIKALDNKTNKQRSIINMFGQVYPGRPKHQDGIDSPIRREYYFIKCLLEIIKQLDNATLAFPWRIGCGAAGGDWARYIEILANFAESTGFYVSIYKLPRSYSGH